MIRKCEGPRVERALENKYAPSRDKIYRRIFSASCNKKQAVDSSRICPNSCRVEQRWVALRASQLTWTALLK